MPCVDDMLIRGGSMLDSATRVEDTPCADGILACGGKEPDPAPGVEARPPGENFSLYEDDPPFGVAVEARRGSGLPGSDFVGNLNANPEAEKNCGFRGSFLKCRAAAFLAI